MNIGGISQDQLSMISKLAVSSIGSQGTVGSLLVAGIVCVPSVIANYLYVIDGCGGVMIICRY